MVKSEAETRNNPMRHIDTGWECFCHSALKKIFELRW